METSIFIAKVIAIVYLSFGIGLLFNKIYYKKVMNKMFDDAPFMIFGGMMAIVLGALIIQYHNIWVGNWTVLVTLIGWIALIKGILLLAFPKLINIFRPMLDSEYFSKLIAPWVFLFGLVFAYFGFFI